MAGAERAAGGVAELLLKFVEAEVAAVGGT